MLAKFACANLAAKYSVVNLLNSEVVLYLSWSWSVIFFSILPDFCYSHFLTKLLTLGILFSTTALRAVVLTKLVILSVLPLTSFILVLREAVVTTLLILSISHLTSSILALGVVLVAKLVISGIYL